MNILHISEAKGWGGNEQQMIYSILELTKIGVTSHVLCVENSELHKSIISLNISFFVIPKKKFSLANAKRLKQIIVSKEINVVHAHKSGSIITHWLSCFFFNNKLPLVYSQKGISSSTTLLSRVKYNYKGIKKIICVSGYVSEHFKKIVYQKNYEKLVVVHDSVRETVLKEAVFIDLCKKVKLPEDTFLIGNVANHTAAKDLPTFVETVNYLVNVLNEKKVHFIQIGKQTKYTKEVVELVKKYQLEKYITFMGFVTNATSYIKSLDVFLITSEREGGPSSAIEAMCLKTPIVSTNMGIITEAIINNENGFVNGVKDYEGLAKSLQKIKQNKGLITSFTEKSYYIYQKGFTASVAAKKMHKIYSELCSG